MSKALAIWGQGLLLLVLLSGCWQQKPTYLHLMLHPEQLQRFYNRCVAEVAASSLPCQMIMRAQSDFTALANQREQDPERFGAEILQAQENAIYFKAQLDLAWQAYQTLAKTHPPLEELKKSRLEVDKAHENYSNSHEKVEVLLAVIAATSRV